MEWSPINPDSYTLSNLTKALGVHGVWVEELPSLNDNILADYKRVYGAVIFYTWDKKLPKPVRETAYAPQVFFANQGTLGSSATQGLASILLNQTEVDIGDHLSKYKKIAIPLDFKLRGATLENFAVLKEAHNSAVAQKNPVAPYHFISYVPHSGKVYELDGLNPGPTLIGFVEEGKDWLSTAKGEITEKMQTLLENNSDFHLFFLVPDRQENAEETLKRDKAIKREIEERLGLPTEAEETLNEKEKYREVLAKLPDDKTALQSMHTIVKSNISKDESEIKAEEERRKKHYHECSKRTHNYLPFLLEMLNALGKHGALPIAKK